MSAFVNHFTFEFKTGLRNSTSMLMNYLFPLGFYAMMGLVMTQINPGFKDVLIPAMGLVAIMASTLLGLPGPLVESREAGIFRSFKVNGVPAFSILVIPTLTTVFHALIAVIIIALTAAPLFGGLAPASWANFALLTLLSIFTFGAIGSLIGVVSSASRGTVLWSQLIFLPSMLLGGLMMPFDLLPESVRRFAALLPTTHSMQAYLGLAYGQTTQLNPLFSVGILLASGLLALGLAVYLFNWDSHNSARRGHPLMALLILVPYVVGMLVG
ncbi:MAG TPA: ABC transporter permease [Anaerolineales bacterium]|jgi:ABC-2 type transport system permease protein|nr:ABC transporter permease [Anaerolineales bacterium]